MGWASKAGLGKGGQGWAWLGKARLLGRAVPLCVSSLAWLEKVDRAKAQPRRSDRVCDGGKGVLPCTLARPFLIVLLGGSYETELLASSISEASSVHIESQGDVGDCWLQDIVQQHLLHVGLDVHIVASGRYVRPL